MLRAQDELQYLEIILFHAKECCGENFGKTNNMTHLKFD